jgi:hypothetical protein
MKASALEIPPLQTLDTGLRQNAVISIHRNPIRSSASKASRAEK